MLTDPSTFSRLMPFDRLRREIDQVFSDFGKTGIGYTPSLDDADFMPSAELHDNGKETTIRVELPGVDQKDVSIEVTDDTIEISGEKKSETQAKDGDRYRTERSFGAFYRAFELPYMIDAGKVVAKFDKGVLTVRIPKPANAQPETKKIAIQG
jgi:HSP20 family protein